LFDGARSLDEVHPRPEDLRRMTPARRPIFFALLSLPAALALGCITVNLPSGQLEPLSETVIDGSGDAKVLMLEVDG
jgi:hypothetical protein